LGNRTLIFYFIVGNFVGDWIEPTLQHYFSPIIPGPLRSIKYFTGDYTLQFLQILGGMFVTNLFFAWHQGKVDWIYAYPSYNPTYRKIKGIL